jgi:hypothetical protein
MCQGEIFGLARSILDACRESATTIESNSQVADPPANSTFDFDQILTSKSSKTSRSLHPQTAPGRADREQFEVWDCWSLGCPALSICEQKDRNEWTGLMLSAADFGDVSTAGE